MTDLMRGKGSVAEQGWHGGVIAHHYTRYLGDLDEFKNAHRAVLDVFGETLSETEQQRMLDEVRAAYRFNTAVFLDLDRHRAAA